MAKISRTYRRKLKLKAKFQAGNHILVSVLKPGAFNTDFKRCQTRV